jgi:hypothetical protein
LSSETAAIASLRNLASAQAQFESAGVVDVDEDGIGEYGFFQEMACDPDKYASSKDTGQYVHVAGPRLDGSGSQRGEVRPRSVDKGSLSPSWALGRPDGIRTRAGYCFRILLPGKGGVGVKERATGEPFDGEVDTDLAEAAWCCYAWPEKRGESGKRVFFVNQTGDVLQAANEMAQYEGFDRVPEFDAAFLPGEGLTGGLAIGTRGSDGEIWKITN